MPKRYCNLLGLWWTKQHRLHFSNQRFMRTGKKIKKSHQKLGLTIPSALQLTLSYIKRTSKLIFTPVSKAVYSCCVVTLWIYTVDLDGCSIKIALSSCIFGSIVTFSAFGCVRIVVLGKCHVEVVDVIKEGKKSEEKEGRATSHVYSLLWILFLKIITFFKCTITIIITLLDEKGNARTPA